MYIEKRSKFRIIRATYNTIDGLFALWKNEPAFRQELYLGIVLTPIICLLHVPSILKLILGLLLLLLLAVETLNSALEAAIDRISFEIHEQSKKAKDMGSSAVGLVIIMNIIAWIYSIYIAITG
jgi:diacylglycerol kinase (ATP)